MSDPTDDMKRWTARRKAAVVTRLCLIQDPPGKTDLLPDPLSVRHLRVETIQLRYDRLESA